MLHLQILKLLMQNLIAPGFVDVHVHLREPGGEHKETIESGTKAAARVVLLRYVLYLIQDLYQIQLNMLELRQRISETAQVRVLPYAAITKRQAGTELVDFEKLALEVCLHLNDGVGVQTASMMYAAMKQMQKLKTDCRTAKIIAIYGGAMHKGKRSEN